MTEINTIRTEYTRFVRVTTCEEQDTQAPFSNWGAVMKTKDGQEVFVKAKSLIMNLAEANKDPVQAHRQQFSNASRNTYPHYNALYEATTAIRNTAAYPPLQEDTNSKNPIQDALMQLIKPIWNNATRLRDSNLDAFVDEQWELMIVHAKHGNFIQLPPNLQDREEWEAKRNEKIITKSDVVASIAHPPTR